jgi:hypothetical protein
MIHFANTNGLTIVATHPNRLVLDVAGQVADVERALHVQLHRYQHPTESREFFAPDTEPSVDARLPLLQVSGLDDFYRPHPKVLLKPSAVGSRLSSQEGSSPYGTYMGNDFRQAYVPGTTLTGAGQTVALLEFDGFHPEDITNYANMIGLTNEVPQVTVIPVDGGVTTLGTGTAEVALDIEMVLAMSPGVSNIYVYEAPNPSPWVDLLSQMAHDNLSAQLSCSWGGGGPNPAAEQFFLQMAAQGESFFNASGDSDALVGAIEFPSASPNITEVGGTFLATDTNGNYQAEAVWNDGDGTGSSGGTALSVEIPIWQMGLDMTTNNGSTLWRNVPDVALIATEVYIFADGEDNTAASGTSCAAPLWAAFTALVNQQAAQSGLPPVGFLNPALYGLARGTNYNALFHDIVEGNNTNLVDPTNYCATPGYDLCTGWGTPAGTNLINALTTPDDLGILPTNLLLASGLVSGPFSQTNWVIVLTNSGPGDLDWSLGSVPAWLLVTNDDGTPSVGGTLGASDSTNLNVELVNPNAWPPASYRAILTLTNLDLSRVQNVLVRVDIGQSIVLNGGFETGDFSDWNLVGDTLTWHDVFNVVATDADYPGVVHSGNFGAFLGQRGYAATLSQTVPTIPGQQYLVSFWLDNIYSGPIQTFMAAWNGTNAISLDEPPAFDWSNFQFVATADDTNATLGFIAQNDPRYFGLDDVTITPMPPMTLANCCITTNGFQFSWPSLAGLNYQVQYTTDMVQCAWQTLSLVAASTNVTAFVDSNGVAGSAQGFYRLVLAPPP